MKTQAKKHPEYFRQTLRIDDGNGNLPVFHSVAEPWQLKDLRSLDAGWMAIAGRSQDDLYFDTEPEEACFRAYLERPRGHSKSTDVAIQIIWVTYASEKKLKGIVAAGDRDQAGLVLEKVDMILRNNPWIGLERQTKRLVNKETGTEVHIVSSDANTSYGETPDFVVLDELTHWHKSDLFIALFSAIAKKPRCMLVIISNAGTNKGSSWQWKIRESARETDDWYFSTIPVSASWITEKHLQEQRRLLPPDSFARLWLNKWCSDSGSGFDDHDVDMTFTLKGEHEAIQRGIPIIMPWPLTTAVIGAVDLSLTSDPTAMVFLHGDKTTKRVKLLSASLWRPADFGGKIKLGEIEKSAMNTIKLLRADSFYADAWQSAQMIERMGHWVPCGTIDFSSKSAMIGMALSMMSHFKDGTIELYHNNGLADQLKAMKIKENPATNTFKLDPPRTEELGHCDLAIALAMALWKMDLFFRGVIMTRRQQQADSRFELIEHASDVNNLKTDGAEDLYSEEDQELMRKMDEEFGISVAQSLDSVPSDEDDQQWGLF